MLVGGCGASLAAATTAFMNPSSMAMAVATSDDAASSTNCQTGCWYECEHQKYQKKNNTNNKTIQACRNECTKKDDDACQNSPLPQYVREPELVPSKSIPNLYIRWQDELLDMKLN
jgi:hypothetical protein